MSAKRSLLPYLLGPAIPLLVPLIAMRFTTEMRWTTFDFLAAYLLFAGAALTYRFIAGREGSIAYWAASAIAVVAGLLLIWVNLAVGVLGNESNPANLLFAAVFVTGLIGAFLARLEPAGMARALYATAAMQFLVPPIAFAIWRPEFNREVILVLFLNGFWVFLFLVSGLLFRSAAKRPRGRQRASLLPDSQM